MSSQDESLESHAVRRRMEETAREHKSSVAVVITRPPEIISVLCIETGDSIKPHLFVVFDSHPRQFHARGAAFIFFKDSEASAIYVTELLKVDRALLQSGETCPVFRSRWLTVLDCQVHSSGMPNYYSSALCTASCAGDTSQTKWIDSSMTQTWRSWTYG